jgi:phosphoribosylglycinamide formyltransferase 1
LDFRLQNKVFYSVRQNIFLFQQSKAHNISGLCVFVSIWYSRKKVVFLKKNCIMTHIAVFASGSGTNCENLIRYFQHSENIAVSLVVTQNPFAGVIEKAGNLQTDCFINMFSEPEDFEQLYQLLEDYNISWIILAGFLKLIPKELIKRFPERIINIHPALLPNYGGKAMYGMNVHRAVINSGDSESGISIHYVNEEYDEGKIIAQFTCPVLPDDTPEILAVRIHELEYSHFPPVVESVIAGNLRDI